MLRRSAFVRRGRALVALALSLGSVLAAVPAASQETPPPTPVPPFGSPSPYPSVLVTPTPSREPPELSAASAALFDLDTGLVLHEQEADEPRPIASITKVMTALLVVEETDPDEMVTTSDLAASQFGSRLGLLPGEEVPVRDLLFALMLQSANDAAVALAEHVAGSVEAFVAMMNHRARRMGLGSTSFASPNGLDDRGYSTAADLATLTTRALREGVIARVVGTRVRTIPAPEGDPRTIQNRNALLWLYRGAMGVKTGYTSAAGFCLVAAAERGEMRLGAVVLGTPGEAFSDAAALLDHGFRAYDLRTLVEAGQELSPVSVDGVEVPAVADAALRVVLGEGAGLVIAMRPDPGLALPVEEGQRLGWASVISGGRELGRVPVAAAAAAGVGGPTPREDEEEVWLRRVVLGLSAALAAFVSRAL